MGTGGGAILCSYRKFRTSPGGRSCETKLRARCWSSLLWPAHSHRSMAFHIPSPQSTCRCFGHLLLRNHDGGQVVGSYLDAGSRTHGFCGQGMSPIIPGARRRRRDNARGQGQLRLFGRESRLLWEQGVSSPSLCCASGRDHGFLWDQGMFTTIDVPVFRTFAFGINERSQIVGSSNAGHFGGTWLSVGRGERSPPSTSRVRAIRQPTG